MWLIVRNCYKKVVRIAFIAVLLIYGIFAIGLSVINWWPGGKNREESVVAHSKENHTLRFYDHGAENYAARMAMIGAAKESLELEFFIYHLDDSSRYFTQALVERAKAGVKVRLLVDFSVPVLDLKPLFARYLKTKGVEVRYYNANLVFDIVNSQHRSHRKLLLADGQVAMTGGRNIGDEYFDHDPQYNFLDTDVAVRGPLVQPIRRSFEMYWNSKMSQLPKDYDQPLAGKDLERARQAFDPRPEDTQARARLMEAGVAVKTSSKNHVCRDISFVTDFPQQGESHRRVYKAIVEEVSKARQGVVAESPYFVLRAEGFKVMKDLSESGLKLKFLTNGLYSTDATYAVSALFFNLGRLAGTGIELFAYDGASTPGQTYTEISRTGRWGVHSKRAVIDGRTVLVGTYNIDPRSANLNSEMMIICRDQPELAKEVLQSIEERLKNSRPVTADKRGLFKNLIAGGTWKQKAMMFVLLPLSNLFDFLL